MAKKKRQSDPHDGGDTSSESGNEKTQGSGKNGCQHVKKAVDLTGIKKACKATKFDSDKCNECSKSTTPNNATGPENSDFEYDLTLWMCLKCGACNCGRTVNQHALKHFEVRRRGLLIFNQNWRFTFKSLYFYTRFITVLIYLFLATDTQIGVTFNSCQ